MASTSSPSVIQIHQGQEQELRELEPTVQVPSPLRGMPAPGPTLMTATATAPMLDRTLSSMANLMKLLPTGTVLAFQSLTPSFTNNGSCYTSNSLIGRDGKPYYGLATFNGFYVFNYRGADEERDVLFGDLSRLRIRLLDYLHAFFSALVFLVVAFSDSEIQYCFSLGDNPSARQLLVNLPLGAGLLASVVFMVFPTSRKGIGYTDTTPNSN
ncbi:protein DMP3-like isoform X2 [Typha angustifolia]|uniref:protein DMP3-like isoform X2 n=1 Tax=Typha angustifolia TaxID=59011 RepID=UPI003C2C08B4